MNRPEAHHAGRDVAKWVAHGRKRREQGNIANISGGIWQGCAFVIRRLSGEEKAVTASRAA